MNKTSIETFIRKYNLGGAIEEARWVVEQKTLRTSAMTSDKKLMALIELPNFDGFGDVEIGVKNTSKLRSMLDSVDEQVSFDLNTDESNPDRVLSVVISDKDSELKYATTDLDVIAKTPTMKAAPAYDVEIKLTDRFIEKFLKAKAALPEANLFTLVMSKKKSKLEVVIGYSTINNDRIAIEVECEPGKDKVTQPINFSAKLFKEIINANSGVKNAVLKVSEKGLAAVDYIATDYKAQYYMIKMDSEE